MARAFTDQLHDDIRLPCAHQLVPHVPHSGKFSCRYSFTFAYGFKVPLLSWLLAFVKVLYDRELSVSEHNVKVSSILNNHSLIMGRQIINILPEGSAVLNPDHVPMCLSPKSKSAVSIPMFFNATVPAEIELIRIDIETNKEEIIKVPNREVNKLAKEVRNQNADPSNDGFRWEFPVKKPGVYRLGKVLDEYKLEVQRSAKDTYVVPCPQAKIIGTKSDERCIRDLSDVSLEVIGTPPLKVHYSRTINGRDQSFHFQSLQPDGFTSPLLGGPEDDSDVTWVRSQTVSVGLNESVTHSGEWEYSVNEIHDVFGNVVQYGNQDDDIKQTPSRALSHSFTVKERPRISMNGCDMRNPLRVAKGHRAPLPINFNLPGAVGDTSHEVSWSFQPEGAWDKGGEYKDVVSYGSHSAKNSHDRPMVIAPGLYTLKSVSSGQCEGQVDEPSSCLVLNPPEPDMVVKSEPISDKCAGNSIGMKIDLELSGTPPFVIRYEERGPNGSQRRSHTVKTLRSQMEFRPKEAGEHVLSFKTIDDDVYKGLRLDGEDKVLKQTVKPPASAVIAAPNPTMNVCLGTEVGTDIRLFGDPPFALEWEKIYEGKRETKTVKDIMDHSYRIKTDPLTNGGEHVLALKSVEDVRSCKTTLQDQLKINVRRQQPRAAFGQVEAKRSLRAVEGTQMRLPLRLQGEGPWTVKYRNLNDSSNAVEEKRVDSPNGALMVKTKGTWEIVDVSDNQCPGLVDPTASQFSVDWFDRPKMSVIQSDSVRGEGNTFFKNDVCEGDIDGFEINLQGKPNARPYTEGRLLTHAGSGPYHVQYEVKHKPTSGSASVARKDFDAALSKAAISMDTSKAGDYTYKFNGLADNLYNIDKSFHALTVQQHVNARPSASFAKPGQSFKFCAEEQEHEDTIPIKLTGQAPFSIEIEVKHQAGSVPETYSITAIGTNSYGMQIPREHLRLGSQQIRIRRVRDARGCQQKYELNNPSVNIQLYDAPSIYPLESREDYCVGERIAYTLSGTPPFDISYDFNGRWNAKSQTTNFRRVAETPGEFIITSVSDKASECRAAVHLPKTIHPLPSVQISQGRQSRVDIHEGGEVDIQFDFWGTPPFEFTYTRSSNAKKGQRSVVLETRHDVSYDSRKVVKASQEGTYEVVAIKDRYCSFSTQQVAKKNER